VGCMVTYHCRTMIIFPDRLLRTLVALSVKLLVSWSGKIELIVRWFK